MARRWIGFALAMCIATACSDRGIEPPADPASALEEITGTRWIVDGSPPRFAFAERPAPLPDGESIEARVLAFLESAKSALKMKDPRGEYRLRETVTSPDGTVHVRLQQTLDGVDVERRMWIVHVKADAVTSMGGSYLSPPAHESGARVNHETATSIARRAFASDHPGSEQDVLSTPPRLTYYALDGALRLAWGMSLYSSADVAPSTNYRVDAITGAVLGSWSNASAATAQGRGSTHYPPFTRFAARGGSGLVSFPVSDGELPSTMHGPLQLEVTGGKRAVEIITKTPDLKPVTALSLDPWSDALEPKGIAVDAQSNSAILVRFFASLERNGQPFLSHDGRGSPLVAVVGVDTPIARSNGAYWDFARETMFLSGANPSGEAADGYYPIPASLETVAHEVTHGVSFATWIHDFPGHDALEMWAINESVADIFAAFVSHEAGADDASAFLFSEDDNALGVPWRSLVYPKQRSLVDPGGPIHCDHVTELAEGRCQRESHRAAGIPNHAFYLMTHGGLSAHEESDESGTWRVEVPCGIGWNDAKRLYWDLLSARMSAGEDFRQMALDSISAARDLDIQPAPIVCAWVGVGVLSIDEASKTWGVSCEKAFSASKNEVPEDLANDTTGDGMRLLTPGSALLVCDGVSLLTK